MAAGCTRVGKGEGSQNMYEEGAQMTQLQATANITNVIKG